MVPKDDHSLESRPPSLDDLLELCKQLNSFHVKYIIIGGMAMIHHGFIRTTEDIDLLIESSPENEERIMKALLYLPDKAIRDVKVGEINKYSVIRIADEIVIDLMTSACGITYQEASNSISMSEFNGINIPFSSLDLLWKLKQTMREKDKLDQEFLKDKLQNSDS